MPKVSVYNMQGSQVSEMDLSDAVFGIEPNTTAIHSVVVNYLANQRQGTQSTLTRTEVSGGGRKPWKQKHTGHARQGSTRSPQWTHGGVALGPKPREYRYSLNRKLKKLAMISALSSKVADGSMIILDKLALDEIKTKSMVEILKAIGADSKTLIVMPAVDENIIKSARNIEGVTTALVNTINVYEILKHDKFVVVTDAITKLEEVYA